MNILLDTCTLLWTMEGSQKMSQKAEILFLDPSNNIYISAISIWEIIIKHANNRLQLKYLPSERIPLYCKENSITLLPIEYQSVIQLETLPKHHKDPFDRMLICQAKAHNLTILSPDRAFKKYKVKTAW